MFAAGFGNDTITGFDANPAGGQDLLDLGDIGLSAADFALRVLIEDLGSDTLVTVDGADTMRLVNMTGVGANKIAMDDFLLA